MANKLIDLTGKRFGALLVVNREGADSRGPLWKVQCDCGTIKISAGSDLRRGSATNCGCLQRQKLAEFNLIDLTGQTFGELTVVSLAGRTPQGHYYWRCQCSCGIVKEIDGRHLRDGGTRSCGCQMGKMIKEARLMDETGKTYGRLKVLEYAGGAKWRCLCSCGTEYLVEGHLLRVGRVVSCGCNKREKARERLSKLKGPLSPCWDPTLTDEDRARRRESPEYTEWKKQVYRKDGFCCQACSSRKHICAHHINGWHEFPEQRFLLENGATLCSSCHRHYHSVHGNIETTKETFGAWLLLRKGDPAVLARYEEESRKRAKYSPRIPKTVLLHDRLLDLWAEGLSDPAISSIVGLCSETIGIWRRRNGLPSPWKERRGID